MLIEKRFTVKAKPETVWTYFTDPQWIVACLPGAELTGRVDDKTYAGGIHIKVGPVATTYKGKVTFDQLDPVTRTAKILASGQDVKGKGGASMEINSQLVERTPGETEVTVRSEVTVTGILAQLGRGMIQDVSDQMFDEFTAAMTASFKLSDAAHVSTPTGGGPLQIGGSILHHPAVWAVAAVVIGVVVWLLVLR